MMTATYVVYLVVAFAAGRPVVDPRGIPSEAWLGILGVGIVSTALAVQTFYAGVRRIGAAQASLVSTVEPVFTIALATLLFSEVLTPIQLLGGLLVIVAVIVAQTTKPAAARRTLEPASSASG
jgi:drug/metabolite transporter (DMT)-like permease